MGDEARLRILLLLGEEAFAHGTPELTLTPNPNP